MRSSCLTSLCAFVAAVGLSARGLAADIDSFDNTTAGALPASWMAKIAGPGDPKWTVEKDDTAPSWPK
jgi:hypothetical protein